MEPISLFDFESLAKSRMPHDLFDYIQGGAEDEITIDRNRRAFEEIALNPRVLVDVSSRDLSTSVLGHRIDFPVMIGPGSPQRQVHPEGERATARAAGAAGTIMMVPTGSGYSVEEVADAASGPLWVQLYHLGDELTELLLTRAKAAGYSAVVLTVDAPVTPLRERDLRNRFAPSRELVTGNLKAYGELLATALLDSRDDPTGPRLRSGGLTWSRLDWLRGLTGLPLVIKGIMTVEDAVRCAEHGADAIVVSNHGGRALDGAPASMDVLPEIAEAVGDRLEVYLDSGVRRGSDVLKALALGARAVLVVRPVFWGLAVDGEAGVSRVLKLLRAEFDRAMGFCGFTDVAAIDRSAVRLPGVHRFTESAATGNADHLPA
jgi:4-hydroxymandelate oxidase